MSEKWWFLAVQKRPAAKCNSATNKLTYPNITPLFAAASNAKTNVWKFSRDTAHQSLKVRRLHPIELGGAFLPATTQFRNNVLHCKLLGIKMSTHTVRNHIEGWSHILEQKLDSCEITHGA